MKTFTCYVCGKTYKHANSLYHHKHQKHSNVNTRLSCSSCSKTYANKVDLDTHVRKFHSDASTSGPSNFPTEIIPTSRTTIPTDKDFTCEECNIHFSRKYNLMRHQRNDHKTDGSARYQCPFCLISYKRKEDLQSHTRIHHQAISPTTSSENNPSNISLASPTESAFDGAVRIYSYNVPAGVTDLESSLRDLKELKQTLAERLKEVGLKWYPVSTVRLVKAKDSEVTTTAYFRSRCATTLVESSLDEQLDDAIIQILHNCEKFCREGSDWVIEQVVCIELYVIKFVPLAGSSYIKLPSELVDKKAIINVINFDNKCFAYAVLAALKPVKDAQRASHYNLSELNLSGLEFPLKVGQVSKFENQNKISVNVFGYDAVNPAKPNKKEIFPLYISKLRVPDQVDLLLISEGNKQHYCTIRKLSRLLGDVTKHGHATFYCRYCLHRFSREDLLEQHSDMCTTHGAQKIRMPTDENNILKFSKVKHQLRVPFTVYADFECFITKLQHCASDPSQSNTTPASLHIPCGFAYIVVGPDQVGEPVVYRGPEVVDTFIEHMLKLEKELGDQLDKNEPMDLTEAEKESFRQASQCHICEKPLGDDRVRDHCHMTSKYRGAAHSRCNINYQVADHIPIVFHGLRSYDSHLIMQGLGKVKDQEIKCIPNHMEKYVSFSVGRLRFIDSFQFMNASLENLTANLVKNGPSKFNITRKNVSPDKLSLLLRKGVYPYSYVDGASRFEETSLPPIEAFKNDLTNDNISEAEYCHAKNVWDTFEIKNLGQYHDLYLKTDILLLADVFENFREICTRNYGLDPCHYYTSPGLAWEASLKMTGVSLELLTDLDMYLFVESGIRGGVSMISKRYAAANNKYMDNFDNSKPSSHIMYLDINNLYGWAMSLPLPINSFKWMSEEELEKLDVSNIPVDGEEGYILCVDLEYPESLHDSHNCFPLAPESMEITENMLSPHTQQLRGNQNLTSVKKLVPNLRNKTNYTLHHRNLQQYLSLGLKLTKIHKVLKFRQTPWLKPYIDFNTNQRKVAKNDFEKDFFKLMNNAVFGKTMENLRKRVDVQLVQEQKKLLKFVAQPSFHAFKIFDENLAAVERKKVSLFLNRPIYAGFAILDLSKTCMYDFHYNYIKKRFGDKAQLLFTDTDSLTYHIETEDIYLDFQEDQHRFDFSDYPSDHFLFSKMNIKVIGKMKDELNGRIIWEVVCLRPKMYSILSDEGEKKTAKGVTRSVVAKQIRHEDYKRCLLERETLSANMTRIVSSRHNIYTSNIRKLALSAADDKRYILDDGINTLAHGHYKIPEAIDDS